LGKKGTRPEDQLMEEIRAKGRLPAHVAIIMDGNGRWAEKRGLPRIEGHRAGVEAVREVVRMAGELGIRILTLYTFSTENWRRPIEEISTLMAFLAETLQREGDELDRNDVCLKAIGRLGLLPESVRAELDQTIAKLAGNRGLILNLALSYSGRTELVDAAQRLVVEAIQTGMDPSGIDEDTLRRHLYTADLPDPDLLIRTSGEMRISNFMLWQLAYSEIWVTEVLWPDFRQVHFLQAIRDYQSRERRFGGVTTER